MALQTQAPVPARWRIFFAALLVLAFWFAGCELMRKDASASAPDAPDNSRDARLRLQAAAIAFSSGKMAPRVLVLTDRPSLYEKEDDPYPYPEFQFFQYGILQTDPAFRFRQYGLHVFDPADVPGWGLGGPKECISRFPKKSHSPEPEKSFRRKLEEALGEFGLSPAFDVILLDCTFPERLFSRKLRLFSPAFFDRVNDGLMNTGGVFAVVLPPDRPEDSACILAFLRKSFGNAGAFCFGGRTILASGLNAEPIFDLDALNTTAELAGYYGAGGVPDSAIALILDEDYSSSVPVDLLEAADKVKIGRGFSPHCAAFARAELIPKLMRHLPDGFPLRAVCGWILGILLAVYPFLRYFISWKPVHKQAFRAFEDMFYLSGALSLFLMFTHEVIPSFGLLAALPVVIWCLLFFSTDACAYPNRFWLTRLFFFTGDDKRRHSRTGGISIGRILLGVLAPLFLGLAFFLPPTALLTEFLALAGLFCAALLVRARMDEPVQPGAAIPIAFLLGVAASLAIFAAALFFPAGPMVFAAVIFGFRLVFFDN